MEGEKNPEVPDSNDSSDGNAEEKIEEMAEPETGESVSSRQDIPELCSDHKIAENLCQMKEAEDNVTKETDGDQDNVSKEIDGRSRVLTKAQIEATCAEISARYAQHFLSKSSGSADHSGGGNYDGRTIYIGPHVRFSMPNRGEAIKDETDDNSASDKELGFDEIVERNPAALRLPSTSEGKIKEAFEKRRDFLIDEATSSKSSSNSASFPSPSGESSGDSYLSSNVFVSEVSSMSTDISTNISSLEISEAKNEPVPIISLPETPPKRKISNPDYTSPKCKKIRLGDPSVEKAQLVSPVKIKSTEVEQTCSNVDKIADEKCSFSSTSNVIGAAEASGTELHVVVSFESEEVTEESKKAKKRPKKMIVEDNDQMEPLYEPKKKKDSEDF